MNNLCAVASHELDTPPRVIGTGRVSATMINASIASALGYLVEIRDGLTKCWDRDAGIPDETNWFPSIDFTLTESLPLKALTVRGIAVSVLPGDAGGWVCSFELNGERLATFAQSDEATALAVALYHVICNDQTNSQN